jgi:hypothetical protein
MASKKILNADNLEPLGAARLAQLPRLKLAGADSPAEVSRQVGKRLAMIARSRSFVDWQNRKSLVEDLDAQRWAIIDQVATRLPAEGLDLMWRFLELANAVLAAAKTAAERWPLRFIYVQPRAGTVRS